MKEKRITFLFILISTMFLILVVRLASLQLVSAQKYRKLAKENYVRPDPVDAPRGIIYDRNKKVLVDNIPSYTIIIDSNSVTQKEKVEFSSLLSCLPRSDKRSGTETANRKLNPNFTQYTIRKVPFEIVCKLEEKKERFPNICIKIQPLRRYHQDKIFSHPIGYIGEISKKELKIYPEYRLGIFIGKSGIEKEYEKFLKGKDGTRYVEVDARGYELEPLSYVSPEPGCDVWLTIDAELQALVYDILPSRGACIAIDPKTGEILTWVSKPGFDPNSFVAGISSEDWEKISKDSLFPLWDRVKNATYPPASVFKLVTCACGIEKGILNPATKEPIPCKGSITIGRRKYKCWETHGSLNLIDAIIQSCDVYFYQVGMELGVDPICELAKKLGFGKKVGIDIPGESKGFIPTEEWYDKKYGKGRWGKGISANLAIGQGEILVTPLQILYFVSGIANNGVLYTPALVKKITNPNGEEVFSFTPNSHNLSLSPNTIEILREGMLGVVQDDKGTGRLANVPEISVAGKTGTAQNPEGEDHAWFVAFAPYENPQICVVVFVENGGMGGSVAAPIAGKIIQAYLKQPL
ncbi:penicillin-binding protein 2 [candidate division WOR-3 bacterium]|nr:penicillin-binding protein 2 [candidate division WOR-3 bacterium]